MRSQAIVALVALATSPIYATGLQSLERSLNKRQGGDAFQPGSTIVSSCAANELQCGTEWCYTPSEGQICCSEGYPCPDGSFCLTQGYCCPDGDSVEECARANGISVPADFNTAPVPATSAPASAPSSPAEPATTSDLSALPSVSVPAPPVAPFPTTSGPPANVPPAGTGTGTGATKVTSTSMSMYTGGVVGHAGIDGGLALVLGFLGYLI